METYGIIGKKISYTLSPLLHKIIFDKIKMEAEYKIFDSELELDEDKFLKEILEKIKNNKIKGINVTIPFKEKIIQYLDEVEENALSIGAVNTVVMEKGKLKGYNTDYFGVVDSIEKLGAKIENEKVYIMGTGGASKTVKRAVEELKGIPILVSRDKTKGKDNKNLISYEELDKIIDGKILIDTTPVFLLKERRNKFEYIFQLKYRNGEKNDLYIDDEYKNSKYIDGLFMLVSQGIKSEEIWQNIKIGNSEEILEELENFKNEKKENNGKNNCRM